LWLFVFALTPPVGGGVRECAQAPPQTSGLATTAEPKRTQLNPDLSPLGRLRASIDRPRTPLETLEDDVVLRRWGRVSADLERFKPEPAQIPLLYNRILAALSGSPADRNNAASRIEISPEEILDLCDAYPLELSAEQLKALGGSLSWAITALRDDERSGRLARLVDRLRKGTGAFGGDDYAKSLRAAILLQNAGLHEQAAPFCPSVDLALKRGDVAGLVVNAIKLDSQITSIRSTTGAAPGPTLVKLGRRELEVEARILGLDSASVRERKESLSRSLALIGWLPASESTEWLRDRCCRSFDEVMSSIFDRNDAELLSAIARVAIMLADADPRRWLPVLRALAEAWGENADVVSGNEGPSEQAKLLIRSTPSDDWLRRLDPLVADKTRVRSARLRLVLLDYPAFFAATRGGVYDEAAKALIRGALLRSLSPDGAADPRPFFPPEDQTRKLERLVGLISAPAVGEVLRKETVLVDAFANAYSSVEVYRGEDLERVFGTARSMDPAVLLALSETMISRLSDSWSKITLQEQAETKRTKEMMQDEVERGHELLDEWLKAGLEVHPGDWRLALARARGFASRAASDRPRKHAHAAYLSHTDDAFTGFSSAWALYDKALRSSRPPAPSVDVLVNWFDFAVADLGVGDDKRRRPRSDVVRREQVRQIRNSFGKLRPEDQVPHRDRFGTILVARIGQISKAHPHIKNSFMKSCIDAIGEDDPSMSQAKAVVAYHRAIDDEVDLHVRVESWSRDHPENPFGLRFSFRHTSKVANQIGGFSRFLRNEQLEPGSRPPGNRKPINYLRDFEQEGLDDRLEDHFEILARKFHDANVRPRPLNPPIAGWEETPIGYVLLKAKDAAKDSIPPIPFDIDFEDASGLVTLRVETPRIDKGATATRPVRILSVSQLLYDQDLSRGTLRLEVHVKAVGPVPDPETMLDLEKVPAQSRSLGEKLYDIMELRHDDDEAICERKIEIVYQGVQLPGDGGFDYPDLKPRFTPGAEQTWFRQARPGSGSNKPIRVDRPHLILTGARPTSWALAWALAGLTTVLAASISGAALYMWKARRASPVGAAPGPVRVPTAFDAFTVLDFLRRVRDQSSKVQPAARLASLDQAIRQLEDHYFGQEQPESLDLHAIADQWAIATAAPVSRP